MISLTEAKDQLLATARFWMDDGGLPESCSDVNNASRAVVLAMLDEHSQAWLGWVNLYPETRGARVMWQWTRGEMLHNFGAHFVAPVYDDGLVRLIVERDCAEYDGTNVDSKRLEPIFHRLRQIGGTKLIWT